MTAVGSKLYVFGGAPKSGPMMDDLWVLDAQSLSWQQIPKKVRARGQSSRVWGLGLGRSSLALSASGFPL